MTSSGLRQAAPARDRAAIGRDAARTTVPGERSTPDGECHAWPIRGCRAAAAASAMPGFAEPAGEWPTAPGRSPPPPAGPPGSPRPRAAAIRELVGSSLAEIEREVCEATIAHCRGSVPRAAAILGISPSTLYRKLAAWGQPVLKP